MDIPELESMMQLQALCVTLKILIGTQIFKVTQSACNCIIDSNSGISIVTFPDNRISSHLLPLDIWLCVGKEFKTGSLETGLWAPFPEFLLPGGL